MRSVENVVTTRSRHAARESAASCGTRATASSTVAHVKPVTPSTTISGTEPIAAPSTGVPQAIASIRVRPKRSGRVVMCTSASAPPSSSSRCAAADVAEKLHRVAVDVRFDLLAKVRLVVRNAGHLQAHAGALGDLDREVRALLGMEAREEEQIVAGAVDERERIGIDAVVRRREVVEARIAVGVADRAVEAARRAGIVRGEDRRRARSRGSS